MGKKRATNSQAASFKGPAPAQALTGPVRGLSLRWVLATMAGCCIGFWIESVLLGLGHRLFLPAESNLVMPFVGCAVLGLITGVCVGSLQWLVLRRIAVALGKWVMVATMTWPAAYLVRLVLFQTVLSDYAEGQSGLLLRGGLLGMMVGLAQ